MFEHNECCISQVMRFIGPFICRFNQSVRGGISVAGATDGIVNMGYSNDTSTGERKTSFSKYYVRG